MPHDGRIKAEILVRDRDSGRPLLLAGDADALRRGAFQSGRIHGGRHPMVRGRYAIRARARAAGRVLFGYRRVFRCGWLREARRSAGVWEALRAIPSGQTVSMPNWRPSRQRASARAVGLANGREPVAIIGSLPPRHRRGRSLTLRRGLYSSARAVLEVRRASPIFSALSESGVPCA